MPPPFLFLRNMNGAAPAVFRYDGATPTQIGNTFGTLTTDTPNYMGQNRVIQYQNDLYACQNLGVYKLQGDGVTWSTTGGLAFTSPIGSPEQYNRTGLYPIEINGESYLIGAFINSTNGLVIFTMDAATNTWTETSALVTHNPDAISMGGFVIETVYQNKFFLGGRDSGGVFRTYSYDPVLGTLSALTNVFPSIQANMMGTCVHNGRLLCAYITNVGGSGNFHLAEMDGSQWVGLGQFTQIGNTALSLDAQKARISMLSDGTNLYTLHVIFGGTNYGFFVHRLTDIDNLPASSTEISTTVLPDAILSADQGGTGFSGGDARITHVVDVQTNPGSPDHYFYTAVSATSGTTLQMYKWNGDSSLMTAEGPAGGDVAHAIPTASAAGGERIFSAVSTDNDILITKRETVSGGIQITFRAYSPSGTDSGTVRIWISTEGEPVTTQAVLSSPVTGGSAFLSGNIVSGVVADGTTDYTVVVPSGANSFSNLDQVDLVPEFA